MRKFTAILLVLTLIFCLCACGHKDEEPAERECGVFVTVEADDIYAVSCGTDAGSDSATHADGTAIDAGEVFHFDFAGEKAEQNSKAVVSYMICIYDKDFNIIDDENFEDNFANMARVDIVVTKDHHIIYKGGEVNCGGKLVVSMNDFNDSLGVYATDTYVSIANNEDASNKINEALTGFVGTFTEATEANRASYESNTSGMGSDIPEFSMKHSVSVSRGDETVLSFRIRDYAYLGTEEQETLIAHNYDVQTGDELKLENVFSDVEGLKNLCTEYILISTTSSEDVIFNEGFTDKIPELVKDGNWYFDNEGLVVISNKGELADTSYEFSIPYSDIEKFINEEFIPAEYGDNQPGGITAVFADDANVDDYVFVGDTGETKDVIISAKGSIYNVGVYLVTYNEENNSFGLTNELLYCSDLSEGGAFSIDNLLDSTPTVLVQFTTSFGAVKNNLLSVDENGDIVITDPDGGDQGIDIMQALPFMIDIDGNGTDDEISISGGTVKVGDASFKTELSEIATARLYDIDLDGAFELFVSGDIASDDYILYCLKYLDGDIKTIPIDDAEYVYGDVASFSANTLAVNNWINILGTYSYECSYEYADGKLSPVKADSYKVISETYITPNADLALVDGGTIAAGTAIKVVATDLSSFVTVQTEDGTNGKLQIAENSGDGGWLINGTAENDLFSDLPYAG